MEFKNSIFLLPGGLRLEESIKHILNVYVRGYETLSFFT